jgi:hypothetical protein
MGAAMGKEWLERGATDDLHTSLTMHQWTLRKLSWLCSSLPLKRSKSLA